MQKCAQRRTAPLSPCVSWPGDAANYAKGNRKRSVAPNAVADQLVVDGVTNTG